MKRLLPILLVLCLMLSACGKATSDDPSNDTSKNPVSDTAGESTADSTAEDTTEETKDDVADDTTADTADDTTADTSTDTTVDQGTDTPDEPDEVLYRNPLNGQPLESPYTGRFFAVTVNNVKPALPHRGVSQADIYFEMLINDYCTRGLAIYSDVSTVTSIGSIRSTRYNFTDLALSYDLVVVHASASAVVREDMKKSGIDNLNADSKIGYRDNERYKEQGYAWEHTLFARGTDLVKAAQDNKIDLAMTGKDYGFKFTEDGTPVGGETANEIKLTFKLDGRSKSTTMVYDAELGKYVYWQFNKEMVDENNGQKEAFENVIVILTKVKTVKPYHVAEMLGSGDAYYACNGKIVKIKWSHASDNDPYVFTYADGTPLEMGVGNTYIAIAPTGSSITW